jgi:hypothetical protein
MPVKAFMQQGPFEAFAQICGCLMAKDFGIPSNS